MIDNPKTRCYNNAKHQKNKEKICAEITYKPVFNSYKIVGLIFSEF